MAICRYCDREMLNPEITTCRWNTGIGYADGAALSPVPYQPDDPEPGHRCHDCGIAPGGYHHPGCDMEICPRCNGQLISCDCEVEG